MSNQIVISSGAKVRNLSGVLTGTSGVVNSLGINVPDGIPQLDGSGKILVSQLPNSVMEFKGTWNAATNTPTLANGIGNAGDVYLCEVAGTVNFGSGPIEFFVGDQVLYSGTEWERASGATGTVTSVAVTESGDALTITGSPITTSGTINIGFAGTTGQYVNGAGGLTTFPSLTGYVPYTGATAEVDLGNFGLSADYLNVNVPSTHTPTVGDIVWNSIDGTFDMGLLNGVTLQAGQELHFYGKASGAIGNGQAVMFAGVEGDHLLMSLADAATINANPQYFIGVATQDFANNEFGYVTVLGKVRGLDTTAYTLGEVLYYDSTSATDGLLTGTMPSAPNAKIQVAAVVRVHATQGILMVRPHAMPRISDLQDVNISSIATGNILAWNTNKWQNNTIAGVLGYTPANDSLVVHLAGTETITGGKFFTGFASFSGGVTNNSDVINNANNVFSHSATFSAYSGATTMVGVANGLKYGLPSGSTTQFTFASGVGLNYTFPSSSGTLALTSDLSGYLPLSGGTLTGKLTINTGGIDNQLQLNGTAPSLRLTNAVTGATINGFIAMAGTIGDYILTSAVGDMCIGNQNGGKIIYGFGSGTATPFMTITSTGVGIGTIAPTSPLHIVSTAEPQFKVEYDSTNWTSLSHNTLNYRNTDFIFKENTTERMRIKNGNVGIGTSSANLENYGTELTLSRTSGGQQETFFNIQGSRTDDGTVGGINFFNGSNKNSFIRSYRTGSDNSGALAFFTNNAGSPGERMRITSGGAVLVGATSTGNTERFNVTQSGVNWAMAINHTYSTQFLIDFRYNGTGTGSIIATGGITSYNTTSDYRLKKDFKQFNGLDLISRIKTYDFEYKLSKLRMYGVIAHELKEVIPYAVFGEKDADKMQQVDYSKLTPVNTKAIQELYEIVKEQQAQIEELKALIAAK